MARLPGAEALGERPTPTLPRRTPLVADYRATSGLEEFSAQVLGHSASELQQATGIAIEMQERHDGVRAEDAFNKARQVQLEMTYGKDGFMRLKGGDAVNRPILKEYGAAYDGAVAKIAATLDNDYQRQLFTKRSQVSGIQLRENAMKHVAEQSNVYEETTFKAGLDTEIKMMGMRWQEIDGAAVPMLRMTDLIEKHADWNGLQGDVRKAWVDGQLIAAQSRGMSAMIHGALASDPVQGPFIAEGLLKQHGGEIDAITRAALTREVTNALRPIESAMEAQDSIRSVLPQVAADLQNSGPVTFRFRNPQTGEIEEGTATNADVAATAMAADLNNAGIPMERRTAGSKVDTAAYLGDAIAAFEARSQKSHPNDPLYLAMGGQKIKSDFGTLASVALGREREQYQGAMKSLIPDGERLGATTMQEFLAQPGNRALFDGMGVEHQRAIMGMVDKNMAVSHSHN